MSEDYAKNRAEWIAAATEAARKRDYERLVRVLAANVGDLGDLESFVNNFTSNADPADTWKSMTLENVQTWGEVVIYG